MEKDGFSVRFYAHPENTIRTYVQPTAYVYVRVQSEFKPDTFFNNVDVSVLTQGPL